MSSIRVLHVTGPFSSGYFEALARFSDRARFGVGVCVVGGGAERRLASVRAAGADVFSVGQRGSALGPVAAWELGVVLRRCRPAIVHGHLFGASILGMLTSLVVGRSLRILTRHHADAHERLGKRVHVALDALTSRLSHAVIANSGYTRQVLLSEGVDERKIRVIPYGVDARAFDRAAQRVAEVASRLGLAEPGGPVVLVVGRLHPEKGQHVVVESIPRLLASAIGPRCPLVVFAGDGPGRATLEREVRDLRVENSVRFIGHEADVPALMRLADIVVVPSLNEAFGQVVVEAMLASRAVIASNVGGIPEIVDDGATGLLVPPGAPDDLARAVMALLEDSRRREQLGAEGRRQAIERFTAEKMVEAYESLYVEALTRHRSPR